MNFFTNKINAGNGVDHGKKWISKKEFTRFCQLPVWICGQRSLWKSCYRPLSLNLLRLWSKGGDKWFIQYCAECSKILVSWAGNESLNRANNSVLVSVTKRGIPKVLPVPLRKLVVSYKHSSYQGKLALRLTLTILSVYRVIGTFPVLKLGTITSPFGGVDRELPLREIKRSLNLLTKTTFTLAQPDLGTISDSSGPNYARATWSSGLDAIAMSYHPLVWEAWIRYCVANKYWRTVFWQIGIALIAFPFWPILKLLEAFPTKIGRLAEIPEAKGKIRVIAITDWWTQIVFRPIHDNIFSVLSLLPMDGTLNQIAPLDRLIDKARLVGGNLNSFDLSAATDRLPIDLQVQILNLLGVRGDLWRSVLNRPWSHKDHGNIYYSVGQPMGCYSSWAMLALSHHVIVQIAAQRVGRIGRFEDYALLGDDIVILGEDVSSSYLVIMKELGVEINMAKSHRGSVAEFAKRWVSPSLGEISPLGAGNLLLAVRNYKYVLSVLVELRDKSFSFPIGQIRNSVASLRLLRSKLTDLNLVMFGMVAIGPMGLSGSIHPLSGQALELWISLLTPGEQKDISREVFVAYKSRYLSQISKCYLQWLESVKFFTLNWVRYPLLSKDNGFVFHGSCKPHQVGMKPFLALVQDLWNWSPLWGVRLESILRYGLSAILLYLSPAYPAYRDRINPHTALRRKAELLFHPYDFGKTKDYSLVLRDLFRGPEGGGGGSIDWANPSDNVLDYQALYMDSVLRIEDLVKEWEANKVNSLGAIGPYTGPRDIYGRNKFMFDQMIYDSYPDFGS